MAETMADLIELVADKEKGDRLAHDRLVTALRHAGPVMRRDDRWPALRMIATTSRGKVWSHVEHESKGTNYPDARDVPVPYGL